MDFMQKSVAPSVETPLLSVQGLTKRYEIGDAAVRFILAGGDIVVCGAESDKQQAIADALNAAAADGRLTQERIDESVKRILLKKLSLGIWDIAADYVSRTAQEN